MIKKIFRLKENEVKKVLKYWKPFFSYGVISNSISNNLNHNRFAIIISSKSVINNVTRNYFRRLFYNLSSKYISQTEIKWTDIIFIMKKQTKLDKKDFQSINNFENDIKFLLKKLK